MSHRKIYSVSGDFDHYDSCYIDYDACAKGHEFGENELLINFDGTSQSKNWWPRIIRRNYDNPLGTYINKISRDVIIMERQGIRKIENLLGSVEVLPLDCEEGTFFAINVTKVIDCIDYEKSSYKTFRDGKRVMRFINYSYNSLIS